MKNEKKVQFAFKGETVMSHPKWLSTLFTNTAHLSIIMPHSPLTARDYPGFPAASGYLFDWDAKLC